MIKDFEKIIPELTEKVKAIRYDLLRDRWLNQNQKHFYELCFAYFDEDEQ